MPTSSEGGFLISKWESNYLRCRYRAHRNKIAAAKPAIDAEPPHRRPHVQQKTKKALIEEQRQAQIFTENLRILVKTAEIMKESDDNTAQITEKLNKSAGTKTPVTVSPKPSRSITQVMKKNNHVVLQWFLQKYGKYIPWWAIVKY